jgi:hypothetical protein
MLDGQENKMRTQIAISPGTQVKHERYGIGIVVKEWGAWLCCKVCLTPIEDEKRSRKCSVCKYEGGSAFDRVACLAERGEDYFCNVRLPEIGRAAPAVFHGLGRKRSHLASTEMVRAEFVKFDQGMIVGSFCLLSGIVFCHTSRGWSAFLMTSD